MWKSNCNCHGLKEKLDKHEKQHTKEHWVVIALLAVVIAIQLVDIVY